MELLLKNKVAWVTGGSRGMGRAIAERLVRLGAKTAICARRLDSLERAVAELQALSPEVIGVAADVSLSDDVDRCIQEIGNRWGSVDILINNAGIYRFGNIENVSPGEWDAQFAINLKAPFLTTRAVVPGMMEKKEGTIVFISSMVAVHTFPQHSCYAASKWGLDGFAGSVAQELVEHGIKVHVLRPGFTDTTIFEDIGGKPKLDVDWIAPEEIAGAVEFLLRLPRHAQVPELNYTTTAHRRGY